MNLRNTLYALICLCGWRFHGKPVAWGVSEQTNVRGNFVCCLVIVVIFVGLRGAKRYIGVFLSYHSKGRGKATNIKRNFYRAP